MKRIVLLILLVIMTSCKSKSFQYIETIESDYELYQVKNEKATLVLLPCFPCNAELTKEEFLIIDEATKNGINVLLLNYNQKLYLKENELKDLSILYNSIFEKNKITSDKIYIGGFSSGGNISLLLSNYLVQINNKYKPEGVFIVDSPIDILGLYEVAQKNIKSNLSDESVQESKWIIETFSNNLGKPNESINLYNKYSPFTLKSSNIENLRNLKDLKIRFYIEPDLKWWKENRNNNPEDLNAFFIERLYEELKKKDFSKMELIKTQNKGFRADGTRHPHSWSIVDKDKLINWVLNED